MVAWHCALGHQQRYVMEHTYWGQSYGPDEIQTALANAGLKGKYIEDESELAEMTVELSGSSSKIILDRPLPEDDPLQRQPDITLARETLGWEPTIPLREGLAKTIEWFKSVDLGTFRAPTPNY